MTVAERECDIRPVDMDGRTSAVEAGYVFKIDASIKQYFGHQKGTSFNVLARYAF